MKYIGDSILNVSLSPQMAKPLDARLVIDQEEELYKIPSEIAYQGMPVVHAGNGTIYVLTDKGNINNAKGWTASYETIEFKACSESEYKEWGENTKDNKPIDSNKGYIREGVFYYIYEDTIEDKDQYYVSQSQYKSLEDKVKNKVEVDSFSTYVVKINTLLEALDQYKIDKETYLTTSEFTDDNSKLNTLLSKYYQAEHIDSIFVKKSDITGDSDGKDFIFVSKEQYSQDQEQIKEQLDKTIKSDGEGNLDSITVNSIKNPEGDLFILKDKAINGRVIGFKEEIPQLELLSEESYQEKVQNDSIEEDKYYITYGDEKKDTGYVSKEYIDKYYVKKEEFNEAIRTLTERISALEK